LPKPQIVVAARDMVRHFSRYSEIALSRPITVTKNGQPRCMLISIAEYERLKSRDQQAFLAADVPEEFLADIEALAGRATR
jgi:prevent-host-death family protein